MSAPEPAPPTALHVRHDNGIPVLVVPDQLAFATLREWLRQQLPMATDALVSGTVRLDLGARELQLFDVRRLLHLLRDEFQTEVSGLYVTPDALHRYGERELKLKLYLRTSEPVDDASDDEEEDGPLPGIADVAALLAGHDPVDDVSDDAAPDEDEDEDEDNEEVDADEVDDSADDADADVDDLPDLSAEAEDLPTDEEVVPDAFEVVPAVRRAIPLPELPKDEEPDVDEQGGRRVLTVHRTLRSGGSVRYHGDVYVYGDVNPGAQVRAGGSVVVMGRLRGVVHAGAQGDEDAFIMAFDLSPTQLRIARHIAIAPERANTDAFVPEVAQVRDGTIVIEPYRGRLGRR